MTNINSVSLNRKKNVEKRFWLSVAFSVVAIFLCLAALCASTYALFHKEAKSEGNVVRTAVYKLDFTLNGGTPVECAFPNSKDLNVNENSSAQTLTITYPTGVEGNASTGYVVVTIDGTPYYTTPITSDNATYTLTFHVSQGLHTINVAPQWGTLSGSFTPTESGTTLHIGLDYHAAQAATCTADGNKEYWYCSACNVYYSDANCTAQYNDDNPWLIPATGHTPAAAVEENRVEPTCTVAGSYDSVVYCSVCGVELSRETIPIPATGHTTAAAVEENRVEATCTVAGSYDSVVYCSVCGAELSRETIAIPATGHSWGTPTWTWDGTTSATATFTCTRDSSHTHTETATGDAITSAEGTDENAGYTVCTATVSFNNATYTNTTRTLITYSITYDLAGGSVANANPTTYTVESAAITLNNPTRDGYTFAGWTGTDLSAATATVTIPAGSTGDRSYTATWNPVVTFKANFDGNTQEDITQTVPSGTETALSANSFERSGYTFTGWNTAADGNGTPYADVASVTITEPLTLYAQWESESTVKLNTFTHSDNFANVNSYLYRVGNGNTVKLGALFKVDTAGDEPVVSNNVTITVEKVETNSTVGTNPEYTKNATDWTQSTLKFTGEGPVKVTIRESTGEAYILNLEIVNANNATTATSATSTNIVLLNDVSTSGISINNGKTLYGNGFSITDTRNQPSGTSGYVTINNGTVDNVKFIGYEPDTAVSSGVNNPGYAPAMNITGGTLYNCYISGGRYAVFVNPGKAYFKGTIIDGGAIGNMNVAGGDVILENCITTSSTNGGLKGLGIHVTNPSSSITVKGTFQQYNWLIYDDMPSSYRSMLSSVFNDSTYAYSYGGKTYVNMGVFGLIDGQNFTETTMRAIIDDQSSNSYGYIEKTAAGVAGTLYTAKASMGSPDAIGTPEDVRDQYYTIPAFAFDYTNKNFIPNTGDDNYCIYDSATDTVRISLKQQSATDTFSWDPMILTATKYGNSLSYSVTMNNETYTDGLIEFGESGDYTVYYLVTDPYNYDEVLTKSTTTYPFEVKIHVTIVEPEAIVYHPEFSYVSTWSNAAKTVTIGSDIYVMPDISATNTNFGSTTVNGQTIYYPIVTVAGKNSSGGNYSSGKIYCFAPAFSAINIKDLNKDTGATLYTYNSSTQKWPHNINATTGPGGSAYYGPANTRDPYGANTGATYEKYAYNANNGGLCYTSNEIERNITANTKLVKFHYVGNDGITYYYYIRYDYQAVTYSSGGCFSSGTLITLADGTQKPIEEVVFDDKILSYNFFTGEYEEKDIALLVDHGEDEYEISNLVFSDGTVLRTIADHGLFDYDLNRFVYVLPENCTEFIGHRFVQYNGDSYNIVTLDDAFVTTEVTHAYSITSANNMNAFAAGLLTVAPPEEFYNWIEMGDKLRYDVEQFNAEVETYGLYTYEDFADYVTYEQYLAFNGAYLKIAVEKGAFTFEDILDLIELYKGWMPGN